MDFKAIDKVGIELEGGWVAGHVLPAGARRVGDGSVHVMGQFAHHGEVVSAPMATMAEVEAYLTAAYPDAHNQSCGMHVHVSFKSTVDYSRLMTLAFWQYFSDRMNAWGQRVRLPASHLFWQRLAGLNTYCQKVFRPDEQAEARVKTSARYAQLNYCFKFHGTIECRLAPVFKQARIAVSFTNELCAIYESFLAERSHAEEFTETGDLA
jgi:hypothetical protein